MKHDDLTKRIVKVYNQVYNELGYVFLEKVYQNAMFIALKEEGLEI
jgi:GxxExxY protein